MVPSFLRSAGPHHGGGQDQHQPPPSTDQGPVRAHPPETDLLTPKEVAAWLRMSVGSLAAVRCTKSLDLPFVKIGKLVRYRREDIERLIASGHRS